MSKIGFGANGSGAAAWRSATTSGGAHYQAGVAAGEQGLVGGRRLTTQTGHADSFTVVNREAGTVDRGRSFENVRGNGYSGSRSVHVEGGTVHIQSQLDNAEGETIRAKDLQIALPRRLS